jgi:hypothetical protein
MAKLCKSWMMAKLALLLVFLGTGFPGCASRSVPDLLHAKLVATPTNTMKSDSGQYLMCRSVEQLARVRNAAYLNLPLSNSACLWPDGWHVKDVYFQSDGIASFELDDQFNGAILGSNSPVAGKWYTWRANLLTPVGQPK